jgi:hypothetical protein
MRYGIVVSTIAHAALIAWGFLSLPARPIDASSIEQIPVDFVEIGDVTKLNKGVTTAALTKEEPVPAPAQKVAPEPPPLPTPAPPPPQAEQAPPAPEPPPPPPPPTPTPPAPQPVATPPPPEPAPPPPAPSTEPAPTPPPEKTAAAPPPPVPRVRPNVPKPKPPQPAKTDDSKAMDEVAALLDKQKLEDMAAEQPSDQPPTAGSPTATASNVRMTADELDALRSKLAQCWNPPLGWTDPAQVRVVLMINLNQDGSVDGSPQVLEAPSGQYSDTAPESALRAVRRCAPYNLPADKYDAWKQVKVTFDPKDMGAG